MKKNVVITLFKVESEAYQTLSELKREPGTDSYLVTTAALVKKENGKCEMLDGFDTGANSSNDTLKGGLIGTAVGILGGPLGMLLGATYGSLIGMTVDAADISKGLSMLEMIATKLDDGTLALVAMVEEESEEALDSKLSAFETMIARFDAKAVEKEAEAHAETIENYKARHQED